VAAPGSVYVYAVERDVLARALPNGSLGLRGTGEAVGDRLGRFVIRLWTGNQFLI